MTVKVVNVRNDILLEANKKPHYFQKFLSTKGKSRGKSRVLTKCGCCVRNWVCNEYDYNIFLVFEEFTE